MDEWIEELGLRCVGKITDNTFYYHANIAYPDDGSIVDGDVDVDFDFELDIINNNDDGFEETELL